MAPFVKKDKVQVEIEINGKPVKNTIGDLSKEYKKLNREIRHLTEGSDEFNKKAKELAQVKQNLDKARSSIKKFQGPQTLVGKGFAILRGTVGKLLGPISAIFAVGKLIDYARAVYQVTQEFQNLREEVNRTTGLTGSELGKVTAQVKALSRTYQQDTQSIIESTQAASQAFEEDFAGSLDVVEKGLVAVGQERGQEFLEQIREYSVQAEDLGLTFEETATLIARSQIEGNFNDKAIDSIKEFNLRIRDLSTSQREILEFNFGEKFSDNLVEGIETGEITTKEALERISTGLNQLDEQGKNIKPIIANLFGSPGEDVGDGFLLSLQNIDGAMGNLIDSTNIYVQRQLEQLSLEKDLAEEQEELSFRLEGLSSWFGRITTRIKSGFFGALNGIIRFFKFMPERFQVARTRIAEGINFLIRKFVELVNAILEFVDIFNIFDGFEVPQIPLDSTAAERQKALQDAIAADREEFAKEQERKVLENTQNLAKKDRLLKLREQSRTEAAKRDAYQKEAEKMAKLQADAEKKIQDLALEIQPDSEIKDIALLELQAQRQIEAAKGSAEQVAEQKRLIEEKLAQDIEAIRNRYLDKELTQERTNQQKLLQEKLNSLQRQKTLQEIAATEELTQKILSGQEEETREKNHKATLLEIERQFLLDKLRLLKEFGDDSLGLQQELAKLEQEIAKGKSGQGDDDGDDGSDLGKFFEKAAKAAEQVVPVLNAVYEYQAARNRQLTEQRLDQLEHEKEEALRLAGDNAAARDRINQKFADKSEAVQKEAARKEKDIALKQAYIQAALAILKAAASAAFPANLAAIAQATIINGLQIASISKQTFEEGGILPEGGDRSRFGIPSSRMKRGNSGVPKGSSHAQGGISLIDNRTGKHLGEIEGGEPILSKKVYRENKSLVDRLLISGKPVQGPYFASGGVLPDSAIGSRISQPSDQTVQAAGTTSLQSAMLEEIKLLRYDIQTLELSLNIGEPEVDAITNIQTDIATRTGINREI